MKTLAFTHATALAFDQSNRPVLRTERVFQYHPIRMNPQILLLSPSLPIPERQIRVTITITLLLLVAVLQIYAIPAVLFWETVYNEAPHALASPILDAWLNQMTPLLTPLACAYSLLGLALIAYGNGWLRRLAPSGRFELNEAPELPAHWHFWVLAGTVGSLVGLLDGSWWLRLALFSAWSAVLLVPVFLIWIKPWRLAPDGA